MQEKGIAPNSKTYGAMQNAAKKASDLDGAEEIMKEILASKHLNTHHFHNIMTTNAKLGNRKGCWAWFERLKEWNDDKLDIITMNILLQNEVPLTEEKWEEIIGMFRNRSIVPSDTSYSYMILSCFELGEEERMHEWIRKDMRARNSNEMNPFAATIILERLAKRNDAAKAEEWFAFIKENGGHRSGSSSWRWHYDSLMKCSSAERCIDWFYAFAEESSAQNETISSVATARALYACKCLGHTREAVKILDTSLESPFSQIDRRVVEALKGLLLLEKARLDKIISSRAKREQRKQKRMRAKS